MCSDLFNSAVCPQEQYWRSLLLHNHYSFLSVSGFEVDQDSLNHSLKEQQELLMKMFAVSVSSDPYSNLYHPLGLQNKPTR